MNDEGATPGTPEPLAYSYIRFSHPDQLKGDSLRRQREGAEEWCQRNKVRLDRSLKLEDLGTSAYRGKHRENPDEHALAAFLELADRGRIPEGSYLVLEALDRLTREHVQPALILTLSILQKKIRIVQLKPSENIYDDKSELAAIVQMIVELSRGHSESAMKSFRNIEAWKQKRAEARADKSVQTLRIPDWIEVVGERKLVGNRMVGGKFKLIPDRVKIVKQIFRMAAEGHSQPGIVRRLTEEGVPSFVVSGVWGRAYIAKLLKDRRVLGEFQPRGRNRVPDGEPIQGYFDPAITQEEWDRARAGIRTRTRLGGKQKNGEVFNLFAGLLYHARDARSYYVSRRPNGMDPLLINLGAVEKGTESFTFPYPVFEACFLDAFKEIDPKEILNGDNYPDETLPLTARLSALEVRIATLEQELLTGEVAPLVRVIRKLEKEKLDLLIKLTEAREKAANPLSESWGEAQSLFDTLYTAPDQEEARVRLRSALRRIIDSVWILIVRRGHWERLCFFQVWFQDNPRHHRDYLIYYHRPLTMAGSKVCPAEFVCTSFTEVASRMDKKKGRVMDIRDPQAAMRMTAGLMLMNLTDMFRVHLKHKLDDFFITTQNLNDEKQKEKRDERRRARKNERKRQKRHTLFDD